MNGKFFCEYCGQKFHSHLGASGCVKLPVCRGMNNPPARIIGSFKVRACAVILARTSGDMLMKSPAARSCVRSQKMAQRIMDWSDRAYKALEANTPLSLGRAAKVQNGLVRFVEEKLWKNKTGIPNLHILELAGMYANAAKEFVQERIEAGMHRDFWFEGDHSSWLVYDAVSMPLAQYMAQMHKRRQTSGALDKLISGYGRQTFIMGPPPKQILEEMLDHCWRDELRSWRFLEGAVDTAAKYIREHGTPASLDLSQYDTLKAFNLLFDYIWGNDKTPPQKSRLKAWLVGDRFWVAAEKREDAPAVLVRDTGHVATKVIGVPMDKKLYDKSGQPAGTVADMLVGLTEPQFIGVDA